MPESREFPSLNFEAMREREDSDAKEIAEFEMNWKNIKLEELEEITSVESEVRIPNLNKV